jgi:hypothetical protein
VHEIQQQQVPIINSSEAVYSLQPIEQGLQPYPQQRSGGRECSCSTTAQSAVAQAVDMANSVSIGDIDTVNELPLVSVEDKVGSARQQKTARDSKADFRACTPQRRNPPVLTMLCGLQAHVQRATTNCMVPVRTLGTGMPSSHLQVLLCALALCKHRLAGTLAVCSQHTVISVS